MAAKFELWLNDGRGRQLAVLDNIRNMTYVKSANNPGYFSAVVPRSFDRSLLRVDNIIEVFRSPGTGGKSREFTGFLRRWTITEDGLEIAGPGLLDLLDRRIVAYAAGSAQAEMTDYADDMIKAIVTDNLAGDATDSDRDLSGLNFSVAADLSAAPSISKGFSRRNVLEVCQDIAEASRQSGTELYFDVIVNVSGGLIAPQFVTSINQPGSDHGGDSDSPVYFGDTWGNIEDGALIYDYSDERTVIYVGGQGEGENRTVVEREDTGRSAASLWNRREGWRDARHISTDSATAETELLNSDGDAELADNRPFTRFRSKLIDTPGFAYGLHWGFGDKVSVSFEGLTFDAVINKIHVTLTEKGLENVVTNIEVEL